VDDLGSAGLRSLLWFADRVPEDLERYGLLPRLNLPRRVALEVAGERLTEWAERTRAEPRAGPLGDRARQIRAVIEQHLGRFVRHDEIRRDVERGMRMAGRNPDEQDVASQSAALGVTGRTRALLFPSRTGTWRVGRRQVRDECERGTPRTRRRKKQAPASESTGPTVLARPPQALCLDDQRYAPLLSGLARLAGMQRLELLQRLSRLSERETRMVQVSVEARVGSDARWGSREHHRRLVAAGFDISQPGLLKMMRRVERRLRAA
jgi:hypothetical protein